MEERSRRRVFLCSWLLQITLFLMFGSFPISSGLRCYCSEDPEPPGLALCYWDGYSCTGDVCYVRRYLHTDGLIHTKWGCLKTGIHHIPEICHQGGFNGDTEHYSCCNRSENCNEHIQIVLPIELQTEPVNTTSTSTSSPDESDTSTTATDASPANSSSTPDTSVTSTTESPSNLPATSLPTEEKTISTSPSTTPDTTSTELPHLKCLCSGCASNEVTCGGGGSCYVRQYRDNQRGQQSEAGSNPFSLSWGCMNKSESVVKCHGQSEEYSCCSNGDYCNQQLIVKSSTEPTTSMAADCIDSLSGGCQGNKLEDSFLLAVIVSVTIATIIIVAVCIAIAVLFKRILKLRQEKSVKPDSSSSDSSANSITTESESLPSPTSTSSPHYYISQVPIDEHAFGGNSLKCSDSRA